MVPFTEGNATLVDHVQHRRAYFQSSYHHASLDVETFRPKKIHLLLRAINSKDKSLSSRCH